MLFKRIIYKTGIIWDIIVNTLKVKGKQKYFCIGLNKTGTTSLKHAFLELGFVVGNQLIAEKMLNSITKGNYDTLVQYCKTAEVFQDVPFSMFNVYKVLHRAYPNAKFILTIRDSADQWVNSITKFHAKKFSINSVASAEDLKNATYIRKGWMWDFMNYNFQVDPETPYDPVHLRKQYTQYNEEVINYFGNSKNFMVLNLAEKGSYRKFTNFIGVKTTKNKFPWVNKTNK